jgi:hypothetical protein
MTVETENIASGLDRLNALLFWWGIPNTTRNDKIDEQVRRFQVVASGLQNAYGDACLRQIEALYTANEQLARSIQEFLNCRHTQEIFAAETSVLAAVLEGTSVQARTWIDLTQTVQDCCAAWAIEGAAGIGRQAAKEAEMKPVLRLVAKPNSDADKYLVHA